MKINKTLLIISLIVLLSSCSKKFTTYEAGMLATGGVIFCIGIFLVISYLNFSNTKRKDEEELL